MGVMMKCKDVNIRVCKIYLPCYENNIECSNELLECFAYIELLITEQRDVNNNLELRIIGDFNTDCKRIVNNMHTVVIDRFMADYDMKIITEQKEAAGEYTFHCEANNMFSMIDYCMITSGLQNVVSKLI